MSRATMSERAIAVEKDRRRIAWATASPEERTAHSRAGEVGRKRRHARLRALIAQQDLSVSEVQERDMLQAWADARRAKQDAARLRRAQPGWQPQNKTPLPDPPPALRHRRWPKPPKGPTVESRNFTDMGTTRSALDALRLALHGTCPICGQEEDPQKRLSTLVIDHNHVTGKFRGLICGYDNIGLGMFMDDPVLLELAALYLEQHT